MSYSDFKTIDQAVSILELTVEDIDLTEYFITQIDKILGILAEPFKIYFEG